MKLNTTFKRKFSINMHKDKKILLGRMSAHKDFVNDKRGDPYPLSDISESCLEQTKNGVYSVKNGTAQRWLCQYFPYASYEAIIRIEKGEGGFCFSIPQGKAYITVSSEKVTFKCKENSEYFCLPASLAGMAEYDLIVTARPGAFDIYIKNNCHTKFLHTFNSEKFRESNRYESFTNGYAALYVTGNAEIQMAEAYMDCGISQADIRPIRYENGEVMLENGKIYLTASIRMQAGTYQGIFSWMPGTAEFELTGCLFYDVGDGKWCGDVAASILYHREKKLFYLWVCSFSHGHILGHGILDGDPRFGVNAADITLMEKAGENVAISEFAGFSGDEDPDFFYDAEKNIWLMAICRHDPECKNYRYVFFESEHPFCGYRYVGKGMPGAETGGSFVKINGEQYFICGNDFKAISDYRIYSKDGMEKACFDIPDGGFRGWGTLMPVKICGRTRYFWLTFDRHNGSDYNWSYGNIYCFEGDIGTSK